MTVEQIVVLSHRVDFVKFYNHATIEQGTLAKLLSCERGLILQHVFIGKDQSRVGGHTN